MIVVVRGKETAQVEVLGRVVVASLLGTVAGPQQ